LLPNKRSSSISSAVGLVACSIDLVDESFFCWFIYSLPAKGFAISGFPGVFDIDVEIFAFHSVGDFAN